MPQRIVIVDDTITLGRMLKTAILSMDSSLNVQVVPSAEEAMLELGSYQVQLVITDIRLPGISGKDLVQWMHMRSPETKIILMTGMDAYPLQELALDIGAHAAFQKPFDTPALLQAVEEVIHGKKPTEEIQIVNPPVAEEVVSEAAFGEEELLPQPEQNLPELLDAVRVKLGVLTTVIVDENGRITVETGERLPEWFEREWAIPLLGALSAGKRFTMMLGENKGRSAWYFTGKEYSILASMVGDYLLAALWKTIVEVNEVSIRFSAFLQARDEVMVLMQDMGIRLATTQAPHQFAEAAQVTAEIEVVEEPAEMAAVDPEALALLLEQTGSDLAIESAEEFWESANEDAQGFAAHPPDVLSFDQALQLGLAPDDKD